MDDRYRAIERKFAAIKKSLLDALRVGANAYANGGTRRPIVDRHFTEGNAERYGFAPLSREYFLHKLHGVTGGVPGKLKKMRNFNGSRLDEKVPFQSSTGTLVGIGSGKNLPILVGIDRVDSNGLTHQGGTLRKLANSGVHTVEIIGERTARITFRGQPTYGKYHHEGTAKMPQRSPYNPSAEDRAEVIAIMRQYLDRVLGRLKPSSASAQAPPAATG